MYLPSAACTKNFVLVWVDLMYDRNLPQSDREPFDGAEFLVQLAAVIAMITRYSRLAIAPWTARLPAVDRAGPVCDDNRTLCLLCADARLAGRYWYPAGCIAVEYVGRGMA